MSRPPLTSATGLPSILPNAAAPDRRDFLGKLAAAGILTGSTATAEAAQPAHPDATLLALVAEMAVANDRFGRLARSADEAHEQRYQPPGYPVATFWQKRDFFIWNDRTALDRAMLDGVECHIYTSDNVAMEAIREAVARWRALDAADRRFVARDLARAEEIIAGVEEYDRALAAAMEAVGIGEIDRAAARERDAVEAMGRQVAAMPALTPDGMAAKVRAAAIVGFRSSAPLERDLAMSLASPSSGLDEQERLLLASVMLDVLRLADAAAEPVSGRQAA